ncbi:hypothetical protein [Niastella sp. OAS944]|uniref:hypothetical protein n=1 Tax=Niastella sp. OAS944 TaxID=2664089 RepID=UPI00346AC1DA|nr:hypothetical protein [Chitinophagaceae bacterium OAS944]
MTAKDLLHKYLNYAYLWQVHTEDEPSKIRLQQLNILFEVFNISTKNAVPSSANYLSVGTDDIMSRKDYIAELTDLEYFTLGEFLNDRPYATNKEVVKMATSAIGEIKERTIEGFKNEIHITWLFSSLLEYRSDVYRFTYPPSGMMEGYSVGLYYSFYLQGKLRQTIESNIEEIDEVLWLLIDPQKRDIPLTELISRFNYPDADLDKLDFDWRIENY